VHLPFAPRFVAPLIRGLDWGLRHGVRWRVTDPHASLQAAAEGEAALFVCRHGQLWPLLWSVRPAHLGIMISRSPDGELLSRVLGERHFRFLRGSSSRDGLLAARECIRELRAGRSVGLAVDGPRGPRGRVQEGVLRLAQRSGVPVVPMHVGGSGRCVLHATWDAFELPLPGGRIEVHVGPRVTVGSSSEELDAARRRIESALTADAASESWPASGRRVL